MKNNRSKAGLVVVVLFLYPLLTPFADSSEILQRVDRLHEEEKHEVILSLLQNALEEAKSAEEEAGIYWRLARAKFNQTDLALFTGLEKSPAIEAFEQGEQYADTAIELYRKSKTSNEVGFSRAYFWKAANIGMTGQLRGVLNSLFMAEDMKTLLEQTVRLDPDYANSYYVLGQMYEQLPGRPLSFGDVDKAVSLGRFSLHLHEENLAAGEVNNRYYDFYTELASHLWKRNWNTRKREREQQQKNRSYGNTTNPLEKAFVFEGTIELQDISDRREAARLIEWVIRKMEARGTSGIRVKKDLAKARTLHEKWGL